MIGCSLSRHVCSLLPSLTLVPFTSSALHAQDMPAAAGDSQIEAVATPQSSADPADGAPTEAEYSSIEEIMVTITKRKENVQDVPGAITGFSGSQITEANIQSAADLVRLIPNAVVKGEGGPISIRGISQSFSSQSPIAQHVNGVFRFDADAFVGQFYDLAGIDVSRGPSGTVYGRNATSGAINVVWRKPHKEVDVFGDITIGNYERLGFRGGLNWPILGAGDERLMARFAFQRESHDGYLDNLEQPDSSRDPSSLDLSHFRASLRSKPTDALTIDVRSFWTQNYPGDGSSRPWSDLPEEGLIILGGLPIPTDPYLFALPRPPGVRQVRSQSFVIGRQQLQHFGVDGEIRYELEDVRWLGDFEVVALGGAEWRREDQISDADGSEQFLLDTKRDDDTIAGTFDIRALTSNAEYVNWIVGFFYYQHTLDRFQQTYSTLNIPSLAAVVPLGTQLNIDSTRDAKSSGFAPYFSVNVTPTDWIEIFGGFRWNQDKIEVDSVNFTSTPLPLRPGSQVSGSEDFGEPTGEIGVKSEWSEGKLVYAKFARGYKAGNIELLEDGEVNIVEPETILSVEAATKNRFWDNRLHLNLTGFYYDYSNLQVPLIQGLNVITENAAEADIWGLELETVSNPIADLYVNMTVSYLNSKFGRFCTNDAAQPRVASDPGCPPATNPVDGQLNLAGNAPEDSPSWKVTLLANHPFDMGKYGVVTPVLKFTYTDQYFLRPFNCGPCTSEIAGFANPAGIDNQPWFTQTDIRLQWRSETGHFWGEVFIENIEDNSVYNRVVVGSQINGSLGSRLGFLTPRIYGGRFGISFEGV